MLRRIIILFFLLISVLNKSFSQGWITPVNLSEKAPSTPNAAGLGKYFDYPVNFSTGLPDIQIPLYTIRSGNISLPIVLKYHPGGIGINENASWVGMGWSLDVGGSVTKRVNGLDDFAGNLPTDPATGLSYDTYNYFATDNYTSTVNSIYTMPFNSITQAVDTAGLVSANIFNALGVRIYEGKIDGEADDYFFSTPEGGGRFVFNQKTSLFQTDKSSGWKILYGDVPGKPSGSGVSTNWDVLNPSGTIKYHYGTTEISMDARIAQNTYDRWTDLSNPYTPVTANTTYLTSIYDNQHDKTVSLSYDLTNRMTYAGASVNKEYEFLSTAWTYVSASGSLNKRWGTEAVLREISFDQGKIQFIQDTQARQDSGMNALKEIRVLDKSNRIIKRIILNYFYTSADVATTYCFGAVGITPNPITNGDFGSFLHRLFLNSVQEIDINGSDTIRNNPYRFTYNSDQSLPARFSFAQDHWGYYNGKVSNMTLIPDTVLSYITGHAAGYGGDREVDTFYTQAGNIREIYYPMRGKTIFDFENNRDASGIKGGLRIKRISNYDNIGNISLVKEYEYKKDDESSSGQTLFPTQQYYYSYIYDPYSGPGPRIHYRFQSESVYPLNSAQGRPVSYTQVSEKQTGNGGDLISKHYYTPPETVDNSGSVPHSKIPAEDNFSGLEYLTEILRKKSDNSYETIQKDSTILEALNGKTNYIWNVQAAILDREDPNQWTVTPGASLINGSDIAPIAWHQYKTLLDHAVPTSKYQISSDGIQSLRQSSIMDYDHTNGNTKLIKTVNSDGDTLIKKAKFANDYTAGETHIDFMNDYNMVISPIEVSLYIKKSGNDTAKLTSATFYEYDGYNVKKAYNLFTDKPLSDFTESYVSSGVVVKDSRYQLMQEVNRRDSSNNPVTVTTNVGIESYIWDYTHTITTAIVKNAVYADIAYTSFESDGWGNWSLASPARDSTTAAVTGKRSYNLSSGNITTVSTLQSGTVYIVSYWSRNGQQTVSGTQSSKTGMTRNGWTFYEHKISGVTSTTISGSGNIDELRLHPESALMSTYTYDPLIGVTSQADAGNKILYYEYDRFNRLRIVRDQAQNILKQICYNLAGQQISCDGTLTYYNDQQSQNFYSSSCPVGYSGIAIPYVVPADSYASITSKSNANTQALTDIFSHGQDYANAHGGCIRTYYNTAITDSIRRNDCGGGYLGSKVAFSISANTFSSTISQYAADATATAAFTSNGVIYANAHGSCTYTGLYIYAKIGIENESGGYGDVVVRFYSDSACTTPYSVSGLVVNYTQDRLHGVSLEHTYTNYSATCSGTSYTLMYGAPTLTYQYESGAYVELSYTYTLGNGTPSTAYIIVP